MSSAWNSLLAWLYSAKHSAALASCFGASNEVFSKNGKCRMYCLSHSDPLLQTAIVYEKIMPGKLVFFVSDISSSFPSRYIAEKFDLAQCSWLSDGMSRDFAPLVLLRARPRANPGISRCFVFRAIQAQY